MLSRLTQVASEVLDEGAQQLRADELRPPPQQGALSQFLHAFALPFVIRRRLLRDPAQRRRYWRITLTQAVVTLAVAVGFVLVGDTEWRDSSATNLRAEAAELRTKATRVRSNLEKIDDATLGAAIDALERAEAEEAEDRSDRGARIRVEWDDEEGPVSETSEPEAAPAAPNGRAVEPPAGAVPAPSPRAESATPRTPGEAAPPAQELDEDPQQLDERERAMQLAVESLREAKRGLEEAEKGRARANPALLAQRYEKRAADLEKLAQQREARGPWDLLDRGLLFWAALVSALWTVQLIVIWLSRDHHDYLSRQASLGIGVEPEDPDTRPRVRVNVRWLVTRMRRRWRGFKAFGVGMAVVYPLSWILPGGNFTETALSTAWFAYWWLVFSAAKSARAWTEPEGPPWFLRGWNTLTQPLPIVRGPARVYSRLLHRFTHELHAPAIVVEKQPYAMAGLGLARALGSIPVIECFFRPFFPVASAVLIEDRRRRELPPGVVAAEPLTPAAIKEGSAWRGP